MRETVDLSLETDDEAYRAGDEIAIRVRDGGGDPVTGVRVRASNGAGVLTDADGRATIQARGTGTLTLRAEKADSEDATYVPAECQVLVERS